MIPNGLTCEDGDVLVDVTFEDGYVVVNVTCGDGDVLVLSDITAPLQ